MGHDFSRVSYSDLNSRQKENYNYHKLSSRLADFGFSTIRLTDDWEGADFIAQHIDGKTFIKVQLKGRLTFAQKYLRKNIHVAFHHKGDWYLYPHDEVLDLVIEETEAVKGTSSWDDDGVYHFGTHSDTISSILETYKVAGKDLQVIPDWLYNHAL